MDFMESRRQERMQAYISGAELDARTYNLIMGGTVVYGLVMNVLACLFLTDFALRIHPIGFLVGIGFLLLLDVVTPHMHMDRQNEGWAIT